LRAFAVRQLYTDDEEMLFEAARPILLNGIEEVVSRPDLGDRAIFLTLTPIGEQQRRPETELWREFEIARPRILGALLDAVVHGLRAIAGIQLDRLPRMATIWATACETALWPAAPSLAPTRQTAEPLDMTLRLDNAGALPTYPQPQPQQQQTALFAA
jgi:hypothetical protein